jgi:hypothetical protein
MIKVMVEEHLPEQPQESHPNEQSSEPAAWYTWRSKFLLPARAGNTKTRNSAGL